MNYYDTYNKAFGVKDADIDAVLTFYGATTFYGLNDAVWAKYKLGEFLETTDPATGKPATANPWRSAPVILGMTLPQASLEVAAQARRDADPVQQRAADLLRTARGEARARRESRVRGPQGEHPPGRRARAGDGGGRRAGAAGRAGVSPPVELRVGVTPRFQGVRVVEFKGVGACWHPEFNNSDPLKSSA